jgi:hypothetical protein
MASLATMQVIAMGIYLALGDSISIDDYTGVHGGGAPSQLAPSSASSSSTSRATATRHMGCSPTSLGHQRPRTS